VQSPIRWEEVWAHFGTQLDRRTIIHAWLSSAAAINATNNGYRAIWSVDGQYYLDAIDEPWTQFYDVDILAGFTNETAKALLMGGACGDSRRKMAFIRVSRMRMCAGAGAGVCKPAA